MSVLINRTWEGYNILINEWTDVCTSDTWPGPIVLATILLIYLEFCTNIGPRLMKNRKPFSLNNVILVYNLIQIFVNSYMFYAALMSGWLTRCSFVCQPFDESDNPDSLRMMKVTHWYLCTKLVELLDTVFFVLRKRIDRWAWHIAGCYKFVCSHNYVSYYLIASLGPKYQKHLWWKKHLTTLQLVQFLTVFIHNLIPLITGCNYPKWINILLSIHSWHFIYMFGRFYYSNYVKVDERNRKEC